MKLQTFIPQITRTIRSLSKQIALYNFVQIFNPFFDTFIGGENRDVFYKIDSTFHALKKLDLAYETIKAELEGILPQQHKMPRYHEIDSDLIYASGRFDRDKSWNVFMLYSYGAKPEANRQLCPKTSMLLDEIPNLVQAFFSILEGGKSIPAHSGPTRSYLRYHLALKVPTQHPPTLRVKDQYYTWKEGESILFDDSWNHEIFNQSESVRAVLIVDILRPMPWFPHFVNILMQSLIGKPFYGKKILKNANAFPLQ